MGPVFVAPIASDLRGFPTFGNVSCVILGGYCTRDADNIPFLGYSKCLTIVLTISALGPDRLGRSPAPSRWVVQSMAEKWKADIFLRVPFIGLRCASASRLPTMVMPSDTHSSDCYHDTTTTSSNQPTVQKELYRPFGDYETPAISLILSLTRIAAALSGINTELLQESATNAAIDMLGIAGLGLLLKRDNDAQLSKLKRVSRGAELAALAVRLPDTAGKSVATEERSEQATTSASSTKASVVPLSSLRSGRGIEKRVVIAVAGSYRMKVILEDALRLEESLFANDLLLVPVVTPGFQAPSLADLPADMDVSLTDVRSVALPVGQDWRLVLEDETADATEQGVDVEGEGFCVVLKKNGRIGTRTKGIALARMVGEVVDRRDAGLDVRNI